MKYSLIIPVYNRPNEVNELLKSLTSQSYKNFEVIIVEDGSTIQCKHIIDLFKDQISIQYYYKKNSGPGPSRNFGTQYALGDYLLILDSDIILPENYLQIIDNELKLTPCDAFGGPDKAHKSFSKTQKAINYAMTSFFTTGGIRGGKKKMDMFYPRSFNMGIRKEVYNSLHGFSSMRFGEDIDFSIRIIENGYKSKLFPKAWVYHKRRTNLKKFFKQVYNSGIARINLEKRHPGTLKIVHMLPSFFTIGTVSLLFLSLFYWWLTLPIICFILIIFTDASIKEKSFLVGLIAILAAFVQLFGYGIGFIVSWWKRMVLGKKEFEAFKNNFYK